MLLFMFTISESILGSANLKKLDEDPPWVGDIFWGQKPEIPMGFQMFFLGQKPVITIEKP